MIIMNLPYKSFQPNWVGNQKLCPNLALYATMLLGCAEICVCKMDSIHIKRMGVQLLVAEEVQTAHLQNQAVPIPAAESMCQKAPSPAAVT